MFVPLLNLWYMRLLFPSEPRLLNSPRRCLSAQPPPAREAVRRRQLALQLPRIQRTCRLATALALARGSLLGVRRRVCGEDGDGELLQTKNIQVKQTLVP
jgi:hypothetical protein